MVTQKEIENLMHSGFDYFISKPFGTKSFVETIKSLIVELGKRSS
jgi:hypothetical protein